MKKMIIKAVAAAALLCGAPSLFAQALTIPAATGTINGVGQTFVVNFASNNSDSMNFFLDAAPANVTFTAVADSLAGLDCVVLLPTRVACIGTPPAGAFPDGTVTVTYTAGAVAGPVALTFSMVACTPVNCTSTNGTLTLASGPSAPTVGPLAATTLSVGPINLTATGNVAVAITGTGVAPASLALACTIPAGMNAFAVTSGGAQTINAPAVIGAGTPIGVSCTRGAADVVGTLTCTQTTVPASVLPDLTAAVTCPGGTVAPVPGSTPAAPGPIALIGAPGAAANGSVSFTNVGGTATYTVSCTPSAGYTSATVFPVTVPIGGAAPVAVSCVAPTASGTAGPTGTLTCTSSVATFNPTFNLTCSALTASIPTLGNAGKALMVLLMLGFGLVGFQLYRRSA